MNTPPSAGGADRHLCECCRTVLVAPPQRYCSQECRRLAFQADLQAPTVFLSPLGTASTVFTCGVCDVRSLRNPRCGICGRYGTDLGMGGP